MRVDHRGLQREALRGAETASCTCAPRDAIALMDAPIRTTDIDIQPLRLSVPVAGYAALDLELLVMAGSNVSVRVVTGMSTFSDDGWIEVDRFVPTSVGAGGTGIARKSFFPLLRYARWEVLSATDATFLIQGVGRQRLGFVPTDIEGCILWLRSDLGVSVSSGNVTSWGDRSGNANNATQGTSADQPGYNAAGWSNGLPTIDFDAANTEWMSLGAMTDSSNDLLILRRARPAQPDHAPPGSAELADPGGCIARLRAGDERLGGRGDLRHRVALDGCRAKRRASAELGA